MIIQIVAAFSFTFVNAGRYYNILSLDGGGIRGLIPAQNLKYLEQYAYNYSTSRNYRFPKYEGREGVIAMKDLFDMTSGTSTGSIISAGLSYPIGTSNSVEKQTPKYFAKEVIEVYSTKGEQIFKESEGYSTGFLTLWFFIFVFFIGGIFYFIGRYYYDNPKTWQQFEEW